MRRLIVPFVAAVLVGSVALGNAPQVAAAQSAPDVGRAWQPRPLSKALYSVQAPTDDNGQRHLVEASDGESLWVEAWLPAPKDGRTPPRRVPTVLVVSPYRTPGTVGLYLQRYLDHLVPRGYAFAISHVRGTGGSTGCLDRRGPQEIDDSSRVVEWAGRDAPWSDGSVGMVGLSYFGGTQVGVAARGDAKRTRYLKAIVPVSPWSSTYDIYDFDGVRFFLQHEVTAAFTYHLQYSLPSGRPDQVPERSGCAPEHQLAPIGHDGRVSRYFRERDDRIGAHRIRAATLMVHGHGDPNVFPSVQAGLFDQIPDSTPKAGLFGWWGHDDPGWRGSSGTYEEWIRADYLDTVTAWFDRWLKGLPTGADRWPVAQVQGNDGQWRVEPDWPTTGGPAGHLALGPAGTLGMRTPSGSTSYREGAFAFPSTPEAPGTYAVFETTPLPNRLEITGQPVADLWVTLDRPDATIGVLLETFGADGQRLGIRAEDEQGNPIDSGATRGFRSARFLEPLVRNRFWQAEPVAPPVNTPVRVQVRMYPTDLVIPKGGWIRLTVAGSLTAENGLEGAAYSFLGVDLPPVLEDPSQPSGQATMVTILHDCAHPSALRFVTPRKRPRLLNVREVDEEGPLRAVKGPVPLSDGGGLATTPVCGKKPIRLPMFGPPIRQGV